MAMSHVRLRPADFRPFATAQTYPKGHVFFRPDEPAEALYWIERGQVQLYHTVEDRRRVVVSCIDGGHFFGEAVLLGRPHHLTAEAVMPSRVHTITEPALDDLCQVAPAVVTGLTLDLARRLSHTERIYTRTPLNTPARLAGLLLRLMEDQGQAITGYSHQHLADMLGTHREFVTQMLAAFRDQKLLDTGYKRIEILDPDGLRALATP